MYWSCDMNTNEIVPLNEIVPKYTHKGRLYYLDKSAVEFSGKLDNEMKSLQQAIVAKTRVAVDDDF